MGWNLKAGWEALFLFVVILPLRSIKHPVLHRLSAGLCIWSSILFAPQGLLYFNAQLRMLERRQQQIRELKSKHEQLKVELVEAKRRLMLHPSRWSGECEYRHLHLWWLIQISIRVTSRCVTELVWKRKSLNTLSQLIHCMSPKKKDTFYDQAAWKTVTSRLLQSQRWTDGSCKCIWPAIKGCNSRLAAAAWYKNTQ